jgi:hypothetical protein
MSIQQAATEWFGAGPSRMRTWFVNAVSDEKQHRDIGKILAGAAEDYVCEWLAKNTGRKIRAVVGEAFDNVTDDDGPVVRTQAKFRMGSWHFETTRRNSAKNAETNATGHVAYRLDEFDMVAIFTPGPFFGLTGAQVHCIPASACANPAKPDQCRTSLQGLKKVYGNEAATLRVLAELYARPTPPAPLD